MRTTIDEQFFERWKNRNVSMWCKNKVYAFEFCKIMDKYGLTNLNGGSYLSDENLQNLNNETTFHFNTGNVGRFSYDSNTDCIVLDFENYIIDPETYREEYDLKNELKNQASNELKTAVSNKEKLSIIVPYDIEVNIPFVQGFVEEIVKHIPNNEYCEYIEISGSNKAINDFKTALHALQLAKKDIENSEVEIYIDGKLISEKELKNILHGKHRKTNGLDSGLQASKK